MDLASKIKGKLPHIFGNEEHNEPEAEEAEETVGEEEAEVEGNAREMGGAKPMAQDPAGYVHAKALSAHLKAGNHAGVIDAIKGIMKSGKGNLESGGGGS